MVRLTSSSKSDSAELYGFLKRLLQRFSVSFRFLLSSLSRRFPLSSSSSKTKRKTCLLKRIFSSLLYSREVRFRIEKNKLKKKIFLFLFSVLLLAAISVVIAFWSVSEKPKRGEARSNQENITREKKRADDQCTFSHVNNLLASYLPPPDQIVSSLHLSLSLRRF